MRRCSVTVVLETMKQVTSPSSPQDQNPSLVEMKQVYSPSSPAAQSRRVVSLLSSWTQSKAWSRAAREVGFSASSRPSHKGPFVRHADCSSTIVVTHQAKDSPGIRCMQQYIPTEVDTVKRWPWRTILVSAA